MDKNMEHYLSKGFDQRMAAYFSHGRKKLISAEARSDYSLLLCYEPDEMRIFDVKPIIKPDTVFWFLNDLDNFRRVYVDDAHSICWDIDPNIDSNIIWGNKIDLSPDSCYVDSIPAKSV